MAYTKEYAKLGNSECVISKHTFNRCYASNVDNMIDFIDITSYNSKRRIKCKPLGKYMEKLQEQASEDNNHVEIHDNVNYSMLEILTKDEVRMYFDIENIPKDNKEMIYEIIDKIYEIMQLKNKVSSEDYEKYRQYALTFNNNSHHEGLSYHLYLPIKSHKKDIYNFIKLFNYRTDYKYVNMIDYRVYGKNRLFRTVGSRCPSKFKPFTPRNQEDYHKLIKGGLDDTVIQNHNGLDLVFKCKTTNELDFEFNDRINKVGKHFSDEIKTKLITKDKYHNQQKFKPNFNNPNFDNSALLKQINEIKDKMEVELLKNKTNQLIRNQDNNRITILMFIVVIVLLIANLVSNLFK